MSVKLSKWDASEYLDSEESIAAYLNAAIEDGDPKLIVAAIGEVARAYGMTQIARATGLAREALYRGLSETGNPEFHTVIEVLKTLNMNLRVEPNVPVPLALRAAQSESGTLYPPIRADAVMPAPFPIGPATAGTGTTGTPPMAVRAVSGLSTVAGPAGVAYEQPRPVIGPTGPISSARLRSKNSHQRRAPARAAHTHAEDHA